MEDFKLTKSFRRIFILNILTFTTIVLSGGFLIYAVLQNSNFKNPLEVSADNSKCNVQVVRLEGLLDTSKSVYSDGSMVGADSTEIMARLVAAEGNKQIKGMILLIDSGGGSAVAGEEIAKIMSRLSKPTVAWVRSIGGSAAYWASLGAKKIIGSANSAVGSIGVTYSYLENTKKNDKDGLIFQQLSLGKYKDSGNPDKSLTEEEKKMMMSQAEIIYNNFITEVSNYRKIDIDKVRELADGSVKIGNDAFKSGLIDGVGGMDEVEQSIESYIGTDAVFCWQ